MNPPSAVLGGCTVRSACSYPNTHTHRGAIHPYALCQQSTKITGVSGMGNADWRWTEIIDLLQTQRVQIESGISQINFANNFQVKVY